MAARADAIRPLKVLIVAPSMATIGGQSIQADMIVRGLREEAAVAIAFQPINPQLPALLRALQDVKYVRTFVTFPWYCCQLLGAVWRADIVHVFSASYLSFVLAPTPAILFARLFKKPVILNYHSGEAADHLERWPSAVRMLRRADRIVVPSNYLVRVFQRFGLVATTVVNAVDLSAFKFRQRTQPRSAFLVNRNFEAHYNVACVLRAFALIQERLPDATLTIAGDGPQRAQLEQLAMDLVLRNARFIGRVRPEDMPVLYDQHDVWLNASDVDNMPLSILEAYASGVAVVSTNAGGIPDIVSNESTGRLVERGDSQALAAKAVELILKPELFVTLTRNGNTECAKYTWGSAKEGWLNIYTALKPTGSVMQ
jgi:glycosyltransferase involved in cell wall biosynthesis